MLSNGCIGFVFNDYSKIVCNPTGEFFDYMEKEGGNKNIFINIFIFILIFTSYKG